MSTKVNQSGKSNGITLVRKVQYGLVAMAVVILISGITSYYMLGGIEEDVRDVQGNYIKQVEANVPIQEWFADARVGILYYQLGSGSMDDVIEYLETAEAYVDEQLAIAEDAEIISMLNELKDHKEVFVEQLEELTNAEEGEEDGIIGALASTAEDINNLAVAGRDRVMLLLDERMADVDIAAVRVRTISLIILVVGLLLGVGIAVFLSKDLLSSVRKIQTSTNEIASQAEEASAATQQMAASAGQVKSAMDQAGSAVEQVSAGSSQSASAVQQITSSIEEVSSSIQELADNAQTIFQSGKGTFDDLKQADNQIKSGKEVLHEASGSLKHLESEIDKINSISDTIMQITDQTNLLALNAAIEAARAGEHGRGFAVVADEVRNLAEESRKATENIQSIINGVQEASQSVVHAMTGAGNDTKLTKGKTVRSIVEVFDLIDDASSSVTSSMETVVSSSEEQASTNTQASAAVQEISAALQQLSAQIQQANASTQQMSANVQETLASVTQLTTGVQQISEGSEKQVEMVRRIVEENSSLA